MSAVGFDVAAVRARFSALGGGLARFDGPAGTQVPDTVIDAIAGYLRESNSNVGGPYEPSRRTEEAMERGYAAAARLLGCSADEVFFGPNMTTLNFMLTRTLGRGLHAGDEILVTTLDHFGNVSPFVELARDLGLVVRFVDIHDDCTLDLDDLERKLSPRTKVVAFPAAANAVGTLVDPVRVAELAHSVGALAWADVVHHAAHRPVDVAAWGVDVALCSPYKVYGPHMGVGFARAELLEAWDAYKVAPAADTPAGRRYELGTMQHELVPGFVAAVEYVECLGWDAIEAHERELGERFLAGLPERCTLYGPPTMAGRVPTFLLTIDGYAGREAAAALAARGHAVCGRPTYFAVALIDKLGLERRAIRVGIVHYNTVDEVDGLLAELARL